MAALAWIESLRADRGLERLIGAVALSEGFHFALLVCPSRYIADAVLDIVTAAVAAERDEPMKVLRIDPHVNRATDEPISANALIEEVLPRLLAPPAPSVLGGTLIVLDATAALDAGDDQAWAALFSRMNEMRNTLMERLAAAAAFILGLPPRLEAVFAHTAPDFWSIRSVAAMVTTVPDDRAESPVSLEQMQRLVEDAESRFLSIPLTETRPPDAGHQNAYSDTRGEMLRIMEGNLLRRIGSLKAASELYDQAVESAERRQQEARAWPVLLLLAAREAGLSRMALYDMEGARVRLKKAEAAAATLCELSPHFQPVLRQTREDLALWADNAGLYDEARRLRGLASPAR